MSFGTAAAAAAQEPGQRYVMLTDPTPFNPKLLLNEQLMRELVLNTYSKPLYEFCKKYDEINTPLIVHEAACAEDTDFERDLQAEKYNDKQFFININLFIWQHLFVVRKYIEKHKKSYESTSNSTGGRRRSKKRPTARRLRSSKARKSRKSRKARTTRRK